MRQLSSSAVALVALALAVPTAAAAADAPAREQEPVVLTGSQLGDWAAPAKQTARPPLLDIVTPDADPWARLTRRR